MKTKDEFVAQWRYYIAGLALHGSISERNDSPLKRAELVMQIPEMVHGLLAKMYDSMNPPAALPAKNGQPQRKV